MERHLAAPFMSETEYGMLAHVALLAFHLSASAQASVRRGFPQRVQFEYFKTIPMQIYLGRV